MDKSRIEAEPIGILVAQARPGEVHTVAAVLRKVARGAFEVRGGDEYPADAAFGARVRCVLIATEDACAAPAAEELLLVPPGTPLVALERTRDLEPRAVCHTAYTGMLPFDGLSGAALAALIGLATRLMGAELRAKQAEASAETHTRLAALGEVTASVGHELGNLLAIHVAWTAQMQQEAARLKEPETRLVEMTAKLDQVGKRLLKIINGLGLCARGVTDHVHLPYSIGDLLEHALAITGPKARVRDVRIDVDAQQSAEVVLKCNPGQITQALVTLINDAANAAAHHPDRRVSIRTTLGVDEIDIAIESPAVTEAATSVAGNIVRSIAARHQGDLLVEEGRGMCKTTLRLPCLAPLPATFAAPHLVADDDIIEHLGPI